MQRELPLRHGLIPQVGYAFVNFTSTRALLKFYQARVGTRWNLFSSEKVLQVSTSPLRLAYPPQVCYANIQGKVALVNKFRSVHGWAQTDRQQLGGDGGPRGMAPPDLLVGERNKHMLTPALTAPSVASPSPSPR